MSGPQWIKGKPSGRGRWLVRLQTKDEAVATVERDEDDDGIKYLRFFMDGDSDHLDHPFSQSRFIVCSFGPIPNPPREVIP